MSITEVRAPDALANHPDPRVRLAVEVAAKAHARQIRRYTGLPYVTHPYGVAMRLLAIGADTNMVIAGLLHDVLEDSPMTEVALEQGFGVDVRELVVALTDHWPASTGLSRAERKLRYQAQLANASARVQSIKLADTVDNLELVVVHDSRFARVYLPEKSALVQVLVKGDPELLRQAREAVAREEQLLKQAA